MSVTDVLLDLLIVLVAAKVAAEVSERLGFPAVAGEIIVGIVIGPSALGLVEGNDVLLVLAELGVILLLLDVGLEMDIAELMVVGRASLTVATIGVILPMAAGFGVALGLGLEAKPALFVGAALTATSVGITARVFGDLRVLSTNEARTVIGAAVADDVMGLVILTVVARLVTDGGVSALGVVKVIAVALGFLAVASYVGIRVAPLVFGGIAEHGRSRGTLLASAVVFTLAFAELADAAKLAPIVGAFVAGLAISRSPTAGRIRRELVPLGHIFVPIFFVQIGIDAHIRQFASGSVLRDAGLLLAVAVLGKLVAGFGLLGTPGDRLLVGIGMVPRGEVGLIFASLGLRQGILGQDMYAALLLVVLVTTIATPPALRWRYLALGARRRPKSEVPGEEAGPPWLAVVRESEHDGPSLIGLVHEPPPEAALEVAFEAALLSDEHRPGSRLLDWLGNLPERGLSWSPAAAQRFFEVLLRGGPRAWRFLGLTGVLDRALPELGTALARRQADVSELDPLDALRWPRVHHLAELKDLKRLRHPEYALLAAVVLDAAEDEADPVSIARRVVQRMRLGAEAEHAVSALVADAELLAGAARRIDSFDEETVLQLAIHLGSPDQARALYLLTLASEGNQPWDVPLVTELHELVQQALAHPELTGSDAVNVAEHRRGVAMALSDDPAVRERIDTAPRAYLLAVSPEDLLRQARLCEPRVEADDVRVGVVDLGDGEYRVEFVARDRVGLLARETLVMANAGLQVVEALVATWGDGTALGSFRVAAPVPPDVRLVRDACRDGLDRRISTGPRHDAEIDFDGVGSPWHTVCRVTAPDRHRLLYDITAAFSEAGANVHSARVATIDGAAVDVFELTDRNGHKLNGAIERAIVRAIRDGVPPPRGLRQRLSARREHVS